MGGKNWNDITRDERTFCAYLFNAFDKDPKVLADIIADCELPTLPNLDYDHNFQNSYESSGQTWELGFEVCFYRDFLLQHKIRVKRDSETLSSKGGYNIPHPEKLIKRTFDLCLFSEDQIVIIEAKTVEDLTKKQLEDFLKDKERINSILQAHCDEPPNVKLIILAQSRYYKSKSFIKPKSQSRTGVGYRILTQCNKDIDSLITWEQLLNSINARNLKINDKLI